MAKIKKDTNLRKSILQAAITGQLISNVEGETKTGKQLLDKIIEERNKKLLADWEEAKKKNPKAKKPAPIVASEIAEDEIPFEIPKSWCWCRLGDVCLVKGGKRIPAGCTLTEVDTGHKYIRVADMKNGTVNIDTVKYITDEIHDKIKAYKISKDDVYITVAGTIGDSGIIPDELDNANLTENADKLVLFNGINKYCLHFFISSSFFQEQISDAITKVGQPKLAIIRIQNFLFPLPPLAVQNAIVAKLEEVLPLVDAYENAVLQKEELKTALPDKVKKAILQEAITGKLTETWRKTAVVEETGKQLLDKIIEERNAKLLADWEEAKKKNPKAKKPAPIVASEIAEDKIPFEIPENWCWCRLGEIINYKMGKTPPRAESEWWGTKEGTPWISIADMVSDGYINTTKETMSSKSVKEIFNNNISKAGTLIMSFKLTVGRVSILNIDATHNEAIISIFPFIETGNILRNYLFKILPIISQNGETKDAIKGKTLNSSSIYNMILPLPSLAEQEKIVEIIEQMLPLCEKLGG